MAGLSLEEAEDDGWRAYLEGESEGYGFYGSRFSGGGGGLLASEMVVAQLSFRLALLDRATEHYENAKLECLEVREPLNSMVSSASVRGWKVFVGVMAFLVELR